ncbi:MAG: cysteinyl-tRNA synthetase [Parcubacteria group bacterium Licking1014_1]|nr:MAG: cysteinyl-tRNA synthetase [Parcubacteria group bacterium Licking1014_1]
MALRIYNTLSGKKDLFKPIKGKKINLFVCGITVNNYPHLGHARSCIVFDSFVKYLRQTGYNVFYLQNITDLDDKIIASAREKGVSPKDLAETFEKEALKNMKALGIDSVSKYAKATSYIKEIISQVKRLEEKGFAYKLEEDGIYFDISKFKNYGKLAGRTALDAEDSVSRIDYSKNKKNRGDFCLWKFKQQEEEPSWKSPWGEGRPGWHIEDTAITENFFGPQYDIHGGGRDLIFPHHEAEISQMEAISGKSPLAKYWMHIGFLTVNGQKMSKSLGNFITIDDFLKRCPANYLRFFVLKNLWRSPVDYSESAMIETKAAVEKIEEFLRKLQAPNPKSKILNSKLIAKAKADFYKQLEDDFNTPKAFAVMFEFIKKTNLLLEKSLISKKEADEIYRFFEEINKIFGIIDFKNISGKKEKTISAEIKKLVQLREKYRKEQNWQKADEIRIEIEKQGYLLEDTKTGQIIKKKSP